MGEVLDGLYGAPESTGTDEDMFGLFVHRLLVSFEVYSHLLALINVLLDAEGGRPLESGPGF